jgi:ribose 5-phosphate isomerase B
LRGIVLGADHGGYRLKEQIKEHLLVLNWDVTDVGTNSEESTDYPVFAELATGVILSGQASFGILVCGTGMGMAMAAGKIDGIRAALCTNSFMATKAREHNNAQVLALGARVLGRDLALDIVDAFLQAEFQGGRHQRRIDLITALEHVGRASSSPTSSS